MGSLVRGMEVEETIFVAVGRNAEKHKTAVFWVARNFPRKKICLVHVHPPLTSSSSSSPDRNVNSDEPDQNSVEGFVERDGTEIDDVLDRYCQILAQEGIQADAISVEVECIEKGIVEIVSWYGIRWLVMGAGEDLYYSKELTGLNSKKAIFVCQHAPSSCHIWFLNHGSIMYTREALNDSSEVESALALLQLDVEPEGSDDGSESFLKISKSSADAEEDGDESDQAPENGDYQYSLHTKEPLYSLLSMPLFTDGISDAVVRKDKQTTVNSGAVEKAIMDAKRSNQKALEEATRRWKEENDAMEAKCKAKALESLCVKEISLRKEMEEGLARVREERSRIKDQSDKYSKELQLALKEKSVLESQLSESDSTVQELEEKIVSAVELLITFRGRRDVARSEYESAMTDVEKMKLLSKMGTAGICRSEILEFSFMEINKATNSFDPSWKIAEGRHGSIYKGLLRHVPVAVKMLPSYGSESPLEFQNAIEILSKVRHPNLLTLIGICPESRSLVYEYARNGSLEDRIGCSGKTPPLPWQTRTKIAIEICSALMFLHSNKPCICHGNLRPSNVLLDANFVCKLSDFGLSQLIKPGQKIDNRTSSDLSSAYVDQEYSASGVLTTESDVYSFGMIILWLLTARPVSGILNDVSCAMENGNFASVLDSSAGDWPLEQAQCLANLALRCCSKSRPLRPNLVSDIWRVLEPMKVSTTNSSTSRVTKEPHRVPSHFVCPIFQEVMKDPRIAADGFTYEADAIKGWLKGGHNTSPMTNLMLEHCNLVPNHALHQAIQEWQQQHW